MNIHLSEIYNRESILKNGLLPSKIKLPMHLSYFKTMGWCTDDDKILYSWEDCDKNEKYIKDMIYIKVFGHARNEIHDIYYKKNNVYDKDNIQIKEFFNFKELGVMPIYDYDSMIFDVYGIEEEGTYAGEHVQEPCDDEASSLCVMDEDYAHNDKDIMTYKKPVQAKLIGQASYHYSNNKINIKINR